MSLAGFSVTCVCLVVAGYASKLYIELMYSFIRELLFFNRSVLKSSHMIKLFGVIFLKCSTKLFIERFYIAKGMCIHSFNNTLKGKIS